MLKALWKSLRTGVVTTGYPAKPVSPPAGFRGAPRIQAGASFAELPDPAICPSGAISSSRRPAGEPEFSIDLARCVFCGLCESAPPSGPITITRDFELAARTREALLVRAGPEAPKLPDRVARSIQRVLGRSLHLRHLDSGSCNACDWELTALLNPVYDVRRLGIDFVASPRHADGVIVTGVLTRNLEEAVRRTYEAMPEPKLVIAVGACAASGGVVGSNYASAGGIGEALPVDVLIPGCPPRPEAILFGILVATGRLEAKMRGHQ